MTERLCRCDFLQDLLVLQGVDVCGGVQCWSLCLACSALLNSDTVLDFRPAAALFIINGTEIVLRDLGKVLGKKAVSKFINLR